MSFKENFYILPNYIYLISAKQNDSRHHFSDATREFKTTRETQIIIKINKGHIKRESIDRVVCWSVDKTNTDDQYNRTSLKQWILQKKIEKLKKLIYICHNGCFIKIQPTQKF